MARNLNQIGPLMADVAHGLVLRPDLVPRDAWPSFSDLSLRTVPMPRREVEAVLLNAFGRPFDDVFDALELAPFRSEGMLQVHRGLLDGDRVYVRILRPGMSDEVASGDWHGQLTAELKAAGAESALAEGAVAYARAWLRRQSDLVAEASTMETLRDRPTGADVVVPEPYPEMSGPDVLVFERLPGVPLHHLTPGAGRDESWTFEDGDKLPDANGLAAETLVRAALGQVLRRGWIQADTVASNTIFTSDGRISYLGFSQVVDVPVPVARQQLDYLTAVFERELKHMFPSIDRGDPAAPGDIADFRRALLRTVDDKSTAGDFLVEVLCLSRRYDVNLYPSTPTVYGSLARALQVADTLDPGPWLTETALRVLRNGRLQGISDSIRSERLEESAAALVALARDTPGNVHQLVADLAEGTFTLSVRADESPAALRSRNARVRLVVAAICAVGLGILATSSHLPRLGGVSIGWPIGVVLALLYVWILVAWRRLG